MRWHITANDRMATKVVSELQKMGDIVVSRWLKDLNEVDSTPGVAAAQDLEDIAKSDGIIVFSSEDDDSHSSTELGVALAFNKRIVLIGKRMTDFHEMPIVEHYKSAKSFLGTREDEINA